MKMWSWRVILLLLFCYGCLATDRKSQVWFHSKNFNNILQWEPAPGENITYRVQYWNMWDNKLHNKEGCQDIIALSCDLSDQTPSLPDVHYRAQVLVNGRIHGTTHRFKPIKHTILGAPIISIRTTVTTLYVNAKLPLGPKGVSVSEFINSGKSGPSEILATYILVITEPEWAAQTKEDITGEFVIDLKNNHTKFCGHVVYKTDWGHQVKSENASFCFTLQDPPPLSLPWIILTAVSLVAMVIFVFVYTCHYVKRVKPKHIPQALVSNSGVSASVLQSPDNSLVISTINTHIEKMVYAEPQPKHGARPVEAGGYSPQDIPGNVWQDGSGSSLGTGSLTPTSNPEDMSGQSSVHYGRVISHPPPVEINHIQPFSPAGLSRATDAMTPLDDRDDWDNNPANPLLDAVRDQAGNLVLFVSELPNITDDPQRKLLLSDINEPKGEGPSLASVQTLDDCSDSGCDDSTLSTPTDPYCNSHYFPSQPTGRHLEQGRETTSSEVDTDVSGYTHNWMPDLLGAAAKESCGYRNSNYPWGWTGCNQEEEGKEEKDKGGEEGLSLLGGWGLRIQE